MDIAMMGVEVVAMDVAMEGDCVVEGSAANKLVEEENK